MAVNKSIFLSHSKHDESEVKRIQQWLVEIQLNPWVSFDNIHRQDYTAEISQAIRSSDFFLLILSHSSIESLNVLNEISLALQNEKKIFVYQIHDIGKLPPGPDLDLARVQRVLKFKFPTDDLERLAKIILNEAGLSSFEISKCISTAIHAREEIAIRAKVQHQKNLNDWIEEYLDARWQDGKHRPISLLDKEILAIRAKQLGLSTLEIEEARSAKRNKAGFTRVWLDAMRKPVLSNYQLIALEDKRFNCRISKREVLEYIQSECVVPGIADDGTNDGFSPAPNIEWLTKSLLKRKSELGCIETQPDRRSNLGIYIEDELAVVQHLDTPTLLTTEPTSAKRDIKHISTSGHRDSARILSSQALRHVVHASSQIDTAKDNKTPKDETLDVNHTGIQPSESSALGVDSASMVASDSLAPIEQTIDDHAFPKEIESKNRNEAVETSTAYLQQLDSNATTKPEPKLKSTPKSLSLSRVFQFSEQTVVLVEHKGNRKTNKLVVHRIEERDNHYAVIGKGVRHDRNELVIDRTLSHVEISDLHAKIYRDGTRDYIKISFLRKSKDYRVLSRFVKSLDIPVHDAKASTPANSHALKPDSPLETASNWPAMHPHTHSRSSSSQTLGESRAEEVATGNELWNRKASGQDGKGGFKRLELRDGFLLITEVYLGIHINKLSVKRIDVDETGFTFYGTGIGTSLSRIRTTKPFTKFIGPSSMPCLKRDNSKDKLTVYLIQDGFKTLVIAQVDSSLGSYPSLLEFLQLPTAPIGSTSILEEFDTSDKVASSRVDTSSCSWEWLGEPHRRNAVMLGKVIREQEEQAAVLEDLARFNLSKCIDQSFSREFVGLNISSPLRFGSDLSGDKSVRSAMIAHGLGKNKNLRPLFWYNDSSFSERRGVLVLNCGISLHSQLRRPILFSFASHNSRLSDNINITADDYALKIAISGYNAKTTLFERSSYSFNPPKGMAPAISTALKSFIPQMDANALSLTRLRLSLAKELRIAIPDEPLTLGLQWRAYSPIDQRLVLDKYARDLLVLAGLSEPIDDHIILSLTSSSPGPNSVIVVTCHGLFAVQKKSSLSAMGKFFDWPSLQSFDYCSPSNGIHFFQINQRPKAFTIRWSNPYGLKEKLVAIARFVMSLKARLQPIPFL